MKTICAVSTPHGVGAVSMIRLSGDDAIEVASRVFTPKGKTAVKDLAANTAVYGSFHDADGDFDDGMLVLYRAPRSYTGEDAAELMCHGGVLCTRRLLAAAVAAGASPAAAGEYTKRAFINGKLTLSQAEAVGRLIEAKTDACLGISIKQLGGALSRRIGEVYDAIKRVLSSVYAFIDYPEEDMADLTAEEMRKELTRVSGTLKALKESYKYGKAVSEGVKCAVVGCPNVGKSSVLNLLAGEERAIVTKYAGTTRDVVTESVRVGDVLLLLSDTAGLREGAGEIEKQGIKRSLRCLNEAELVLAVFDGSKPQSDADGEVVRRIEEAGLTAQTVAIVNKCDKSKLYPYNVPFPQVSLSAKTGEGTHGLQKAIEALYGEKELSGGEIITSARQYGAVCRALEHVDKAVSALESGFTQDVAGLDAELAAEALSELDGRSVSEDIVNEIFSRFCVGK